MMRRVFVYLPVLVLSFLLGCAGHSHSPQPASSGPAEGPVPYYPNQLTTVNGIAFHPNGRELYVSHWAGQRSEAGKPQARIARYSRLREGWSSAQRVSFSDAYSDYQPVLSSDGQQLYFTSSRPLQMGGPEVRQNIWFARRQGDDWTEPEVIRELVTDGWDGHAVPTHSGRLYFVSDRPGGQGGTDIWVASFDEGSFQSAAAVTAVNTADSESDLWVDPEERFMIFGRYVAKTQSIDLWLSEGQAGVWSEPRLAGAVNGPGWELSPTVSPDGRYFFFQTEGTLQRVELATVLAG